MMKKINIKKFTASALLGILLCFGCVFGMAGFPVNADAAGGTTKTWKVDTSFRTRVTTELSKANEFKGGTIEFDLIDSDLKRDFDGNVALIPDDYKLKNHSFDKSYAYNMRRQNYASINFNFYKTNEKIEKFSWRVGGADDGNDKKQNENQLASFSYYADGRIVEYSGDAGNWQSRDQRVITPATVGFVGTQEDLGAFMTPKYSYRIEWVWGMVKADKTVIVSTPEEMKEMGANARQAWYVVYSKPISAPASEYEVLFAFKTSKAASMLTAAETANTLGGYAGFEISANMGYLRNGNGDNHYVYERNTQTGGMNGFDQNVRMEFDNVAIYDGYNYDGGEKKAKSGFENMYTDFTDLGDSGIQSGKRAFSPTKETEKSEAVSVAFYEYGAYGGRLTDTFYDRHDTTVDGLRVQIVNSSKESISTPAKSEISERNTHTITFTDGENTLFTQDVIHTFPATLPNNRFGGKFYRWELPAGAEFDSVTQDITVVGTATDKRYITYDANGGTGEIARVEQTVGTSVKLSDGVGFTRAAYDLIGWTTDKNGEKEFDLSEDYTITDDDITLYAVWKIVSYKTEFTMPDGTVLARYETVHGTNAYYDGKVPALSGKAFIGWDKSVLNITQETTFVAQFADDYDEFADNKVVNADFGAGVTKAETLSFYRILPQNDGVKIRLDIGEISGFDKVELVLGGSDGNDENTVSVDITAYAQDYTTVLFETDAWTYSVSAKPLDCSDEEFEPQIRKNLLKSVGGGNFGVNFVTAASGTPTLSLNELSIREKSDLQTDAMQWGTAVSLSAGGETIVGGVTGVKSTVAATLDTQDKPREFTVEFKDGESGEIIAERYVYSGGKATAPKVKGYNYDFVNETNVTANKQIDGNGTKNTYTATFSAGEDYTFDDKQFGYGDKVTLPTAQDKDISYKMIVGWAETQNAAEYAFVAGEEISLQVDKNVTLYPVWGLKTYTVTYLGEDGSVLYTEKVPHGASATYGGETPIKDGYAFDGWDPYPTAVTKDISVKVVFKSLAQNKFRVIVADGTGSGSYASGETVTIAADEKSGFDFKSWATENDIDITYKDGVYSFVMPSGDVSVAATYKEKTTFASLVRDVFIWVALALIVVASGAFTFVFMRKKKNK